LCVKTIEKIDFISKNQTDEFFNYDSRDGIMSDAEAR